MLEWATIHPWMTFVLCVLSIGVTLVLGGFALVSIDGVITNIINLKLRLAAMRAAEAEDDD